MIKKFIPNSYYKSIFDIPYAKLYEDGYRLILTDLDNTLISYRETLPNDRIKKLKEEIEALGFEFILVSNSKKARVDNFAKDFNIPYVKFATKPLKRGIKKAIKKVAKNRYDKNQIIIMGDQLITDILGGNRCGITTFLIEPIERESEAKVTKRNRKIERFFLKKIKKKYPLKYEELLNDFGGDLKWL